jgi:hypothetical protein
VPPRPARGAPRRVLQPDEPGQLSKRDLEDRPWVVEREAQVPEHLHAHDAVEPYPAEQEGEQGTQREVRADPVAVAHQLPTQARVDLLGRRDWERVLLPQLQEQGVEGAREPARALFGEIIVLDVDTGQRRPEQQAELGLMSQRPLAEPLARRGHLLGHLPGRRAAAAASSVDRRMDLVGELTEDVPDDAPDQFLMAVEVPVEGRRGHAHLPGDGPQCHCLRPLLDEDPARGLLDLLGGGGPGAIAPAQCLDHVRLPARLVTSLVTPTRNDRW